MTKLSEMPAGPFFDAIREWDARAEKNRAEFREKTGYDLPEGHIPVSATFMRLWNEALDKLGETS